MQFFESLLAPADKTLGRLLFHHFSEFLHIAGRLGLKLGVFDDMLGGLADDVADVVEAAASGPARDLVEIAGAERGDLLASILAEAGEKDGADRNVDADTERVGAK